MYDTCLIADSDVQAFNKAVYNHLKNRVLVSITYKVQTFSNGNYYTVFIITKKVSWYVKLFNLY